ncbi:hypothetical protein HanIR_Chr12g0589331 [Helianthus annuus]|nr:hypothetical protein HanIR_Chr12g0589331 [Helianthus annuus]
MKGNVEVEEEAQSRSTIRAAPISPTHTNTNLVDFLCFPLLSPSQSQSQSLATQQISTPPRVLDAQSVGDDRQAPPFIYYCFLENNNNHNHNQPIFRES